MSEVSDALVICVSEETGKVSYATSGRLVREITPEQLRAKLVELQNREETSPMFTLKKGRRDDERKTEK